MTTTGATDAMTTFDQFSANTAKSFLGPSMQQHIRLGGILLTHRTGKLDYFRRRLLDCLVRDIEHRPATFTKDRPAPSDLLGHTARLAVISLSHAPRRLPVCSNHGQLARIDCQTDDFAIPQSKQLRWWIHAPGQRHV